MSSLEKPLAILLPLVTAVGGTTARTLLFALLVCTLAVQSVALNTHPSLLQTIITTTTEASSVQMRKRLPLDPDPEPFLGTVKSTDTFERVERRQTPVPFALCGDQGCDCGECEHSVGLFLYQR